MLNSIKCSKTHKIRRLFHTSVYFCAIIDTKWLMFLIWEKLYQAVDTMGQYMWLCFIFLDTTCVNMFFFMLILFFHCSPFFAYAYVYNVSFWGKVLTFTDSSGCSVYFLKNTFNLYLNQYQPNLKPSPSTKSAPYSFRNFFWNTWIDSFRHKEIDKMYCSYPFWIRMVFCLPSFWAFFSYYPNTIQYIKIHSHNWNCSSSVLFT